MPGLVQMTNDKTSSSLLAFRLNMSLRSRACCTRPVGAAASRGQPKWSKVVFISRPSFCIFTNQAASWCTRLVRYIKSARATYHCQAGAVRRCNTSSASYWMLKPLDFGSNHYVHYPCSVHLHVRCL